MDRIQELYEEIRRLEKENEESLKSKYQYLVGKWIHCAHTSYEKITNICRVNTSEDGEEVVYDCIHVYYDNRGDEYNNGASICLDGYGTIEENDIDRYLISQDKINESLNSCIEFFKKKIIG